jgi:adenylate cyclase, class 2
VIEVELKARLARPYHVRAALRRRSEPERVIYRDTYYDTPAGDLHQTGQEIRLRTVETPDDVRHLLTFKEAAVDAGSGSKPEYETAVTTPSAVARMLGALGLVPFVELTKHCDSHRFTDDGRDFTATVADVPEIDGTFIEVETLAAENDLDGALAAVRQVLARLGVGEEQLTTERYLDAVRAAR